MVFSNAFCLLSWCRKLRCSVTQMKIKHRLTANLEILLKETQRYEEYFKFYSDHQAHFQSIIKSGSLLIQIHFFSTLSGFILPDT